MKQFLITFVILSLSIPSLWAQNWQIVDSPLKENINGITFVGPDTMFIITDKGNMARSFDAGKTWDTFRVTFGTSLEDIQFFTSDTGYVCGAKGSILYTTDGGYTWDKEPINDTVSWLFDIQMFSRKVGLVAGLTNTKNMPFGGVAYRTTNGGKNWKKLKTFGLGYSEIFYQPNHPVYLLSYGKINYSNDLGKTWKSTLTVEGKPGRALSFYGKTGIVCGLQGMCAYSNDTGKTWYPAQQDKQTMFIAAQMVDEENGYIGGTKATILKTSDGGKTWDKESLPQSFNIYDFYLVGNRLYAVGTDGSIIFKKVK